LSPAVTRIAPHLIEVVAGGEIVGYVEIADTIFVALAGRRYDRAVEVGQALDFDDAVGALVLAA
jgi:hypothetical protein